jgi:hypothetical protein
MRILFRTIFIFIFIVITISVIAFARGYRPDFTSGSLTSTGIIATSSSPRASKVYVNGLLKGVTDLNLTLPPGKYNVEIKRDGYHTWSKELTLKGELVAIVDPVLFPLNPSLSPLTNLGIVKAVPIANGEKILIFTETGDELKDGIYTFDVNQRPLSFLPPLSPIILKKDIPVGVNYNLKDSVVRFSPDYKKMIIEFISRDELGNEQKFAYLFNTSGENQTPLDTTFSEENVLTAWDLEKNEQNIKILQTFPKEIAKVASDSMQVVSYSPDKKKFLYRAKQDIELAHIKKPLIASNQTEETRNLRKGDLYVYDKEEDKNFAVRFSTDYEGDILHTPIPTLTKPFIQKQTLRPSPTPSIAEAELPPVLWYFDSKHLILMENTKVSAMDYDGTNRKTVYSGPFSKSFLVNTSDGKIVVLANLNPENNPLPDLYLVGIR